MSVQKERAPRELNDDNENLEGTVRKHRKANKRKLEQVK
jgi:hypothetical protein